MFSKRSKSEPDLAVPGLPEAARGGALPPFQGYLGRTSLGRLGSKAARRREAFRRRRTTGLRCHLCEVSQLMPEAESVRAASELFV